MSDHYILNGHEVVPVDLLTWARFFANFEHRVVAKTTVGGAMISTVFLGLDHNYGGGRPHIFETMVFGGPLDEDQMRYSTWDEAQRGHDAMVQRVTEAKP